MEAGDDKEIVPPSPQDDQEYNNYEPKIEDEVP